jgi:RNA polymerase sigma-70 factor (ECF subfamily)
MTQEKESIHQALMSLAHLEYSKGLNSHAFFKINNHALGEDLVQDTFLKTWTYLVKGGEIILMKAFLYHVLNNLIIDEYRKRKNMSLDELLEKGYEAKDVDQENSIDRSSDRLEGENAVELLEQLPDLYRDIMKMKYVEDMTITEIAKRTKKTKNSITVLLHRGLEKLKVLHAKRGNIFD